MKLQTKVEVTNPLGAGTPQTIWTCDLLPRGSGNRKHAQKLAHFLEHHPSLDGHIERIETNSSRVRVHLKPSFNADTWAELHADPHAA
jgi:hypothetical protein